MRGRLVLILAPVIALAGFSVLLGVAAFVYDRHRVEMLIAAGIVTWVALFLAVVLLYRQVRGRQATGRALENVQARVSDVVESAMDAIITIDARQHIVLFNAAAEIMFGCSRQEAVGAPLAGFIPERFRGIHGDHVRRFGEAGTTSRRMGALRVVTGVRRNGEEFPIDASISQLSEHGSKLFTVMSWFFDKSTEFRKVKDVIAGLSPVTK